MATSKPRGGTTPPRKWAIMPAGQGWRAVLAEKKAQWTDRNLDEIHQEIEDDVYVRGLNGEQLMHVARWYGVGMVEFERAYGDVWRLGQAEMRNIIAQDTLRYGLTSKIPVAKIWMGKALGGLGETSTKDVDVEGDGDGNVQINVRVIRKEPEAS